METASFLSRLKGVKKSGQGWTAQCPSHADQQNSLSVSAGQAGVLVKCFAGCEPKSITDALGLELRDLFFDNGGNGSHNKPVLRSSTLNKTTPVSPTPNDAPRRLPVTVAELAAHKKIPEDFLRDRFKMSDSADGVVIPYLDSDGSVFRDRLRNTLKAGDGSRWLAGSGQTAYGLHLLDAARHAGYVIFVEGESDTWTAHYHGFPALGIPGADGVKVAKLEHLEGLTRVYYVREPDKGGDTFALKLPAHLKAIGFTDSILEIILPGMKDLSELHLKNEAEFKAILAGLIESALSAPEADKDAADVQPEPLSDDTSILIAELAGMSPIEYDQRRKEAAEKLRIRVETLDQEVKQARLANQPQATTTNGTAIFMEEVELWPEPVDGAELLNELAATFKRHVALPDFADALLALWVVFTYAMDAAFTAPILAITSPQKRCGKTTLLALLSQFVHKPLSASNITAAAFFRSIEKWMPTLLVDEADTFLKDKEELRGVINAGHTRSTAYVIRTVGDDHEPTQFNVWGAKAIAMIGALPDTIADRSINVTMRRRRPDEKIEKLRVDRTGSFNDLARRCARWSSDNMGRLKAADPSMPDSLHDRAADNWRPLLAIADAVGGKWPELARKAAVVLSGSDSADDDSAGVMLLTDIQTIFKEDGSLHLASADIVKKLVKIEERPWPGLSGMTAQD